MRDPEPPLTGKERELFKEGDLDSCLQCRPSWLVNGLPHSPNFSYFALTVFSPQFKQ